MRWWCALAGVRSGALQACVRVVQVEFTKLEFSHLPAREKREEEIRLYKEKQAAAADAATDSLDVSDRQPVFLKDKGDALHAQRNYAAALNAYTRAIDGEGEDSLLALRCRCARHARTHTAWLAAHRLSCTRRGLQSRSGSLCRGSR